MDDKKYSFSMERYQSELASKLRILISDASAGKALADYLGVSIQAVNQYKDGSSLPKVENLVKIAQFYNCSLDYLVGLDDVQKPVASLKAACEYTGLSQEAVEMLHYLTRAGSEEQMTISFINRVLSNPSKALGYSFLTPVTLFSWMEQYIKSDSARIEGDNRKDIPMHIDSSYVKYFNPAPVYAEYLKSEIIKMMDAYRKEENGE